MSTFTSILQQKINNLEAQVRQLQEQNYHLRNRARWLMEAASSTDMSMLQQPEVQDMPQTPSGQYGGQADRYTNYTLPFIPTLPKGLSPLTDSSWTYDSGPPKSWSKTINGISYRMVANENGTYELYVDDGRSGLRYVFRNSQWVLS